MKNSTTKELVAEFLETKGFLNSRQAFRNFKELNPNVKVSQAYFYTLFSSFGKRETKKNTIQEVISSNALKTPMAAYRKYVDLEKKPVSFAYFLNVWKRHFKIEGTVRTKKVEKPVNETVQLSSLTAREIVKKVEELTKSTALLSVNLKNKDSIVKKASEILNNAGFKTA
jgi:hypothetical protein